MTKNKKRKTILRTIAENEGVGIARAGMLHDRERVEKNLDPAMQFILNRERRLGWLLTTFEGSDFNVHFDSDSPGSLMTTTEDISAKRGVPHYVIDKGTQAQRFRFMNSIRHQFEDHFAVNVTVLKKQKLQTELFALMMVHNMNVSQIADADLSGFAALREKFIKENGTAMVDFAPAYNYVLIYDWNEVMADASTEVKDMVHFLLENGKHSGIHFIISTGSDDQYVKAWDERGLVRFITIRSAYSGHPESAVMKLKDLWTGIQIPTW